MIREKFHVDPIIEFYDSPVLVENGMEKAGYQRGADLE
jgi:hypothetical protein